MCHAGKEVSQYIEKGQLVPDDLVTKMILEELSTSLRNQSYLLDGFPRTIPQAESLHKFEKLDVCINLDVPEQEIMNRIQGKPRPADVHLLSSYYHVFYALFAFLDSEEC